MVAVDHWNTDNPHTHIVLRGRDGSGKNLIISRDYISQGMRERGDIIRTMQRAMGGKQRDLTVFQPGEDGPAVAATIRGGGVSWEVGRQRGMSIS